MSEGDIEVISGSYGVRNVDVGSATLAIQFGEPVRRLASSGTYYGAHLQNGAPSVGSDVFLGIANRVSTQTTTLDGKVEVNLVGAGTVLFGDATTAANVDTAAELLLIMLNNVAFDVTSTVYTIDEDEADKATLGLQIVGGDVTRSKLYVQVHVNCTSQASLIGVAGI